MVLDPDERAAGAALAQISIACDCSSAPVMPVRSTISWRLPSLTCFGRSR